MHGETVKFVNNIVLNKNNIVLNKKVHVLVFYTLLNWKMHGETVKCVRHSLGCYT